MHDRLRARIAQVEHQAAFSAVVPLEALAGSRHHAARAAEGVALGRLHLDDVRAEVGEELPDHRAGDDLAELEHADTGEGACCHRASFSPLSGVVASARTPPP